MNVFSIYDDNVAEAIFIYTDIFFKEYKGYCIENCYYDRISPLEWVIKQRFEDFREFCQSKFDFDVKR